MPVDELQQSAQEEKCPCCDNPWARATGDLFAQMCLNCKEVQEKSTTSNAASFGLSVANMDLTVKPEENFYVYANGGWMKKNPIPSGYPNWNSFLALHVQSQERCRSLLEELTTTATTTAADGTADASGGEHKDEAMKVAAFYSAALQEDAIEALGVKPMAPLLSIIEDIVKAKSNHDDKSYAELLGKLDAFYGIAAFFVIGARPDAKNSDHTICQVYQGGLGLPDRDYYFDQDKQAKRDAYQQHVAKMLSLVLKPEDDTANVTEEAMHEAATTVFELEKSLAEAHMTRTENRDPHAIYNKMSIADLSKRADDVFDFAAYFYGSTGKTVDELGDINVCNTAALERAARLAASMEPTTLKFYLQWHAVNSCAPHMSKAFVEQDFDFFQKTLQGVAELKPRWKRAMEFTERALGDALGKLYCSKYFDESCKTRATAIVEEVRKALEARLNEVEWMKSDSTRQEALKKMSRFRVKMGYPSFWKDYSSMVFEEGESFLSMVFKSRACEHSRVVKEMNLPTNREKWSMTPQTVNAYYSPMLNEIVFPAAILQHPFFDLQADDAVNFGAMGAVVGHEMTHGFDDKGRKFNYAGILQDWWTPEDSAEYEQRVQVMVDQADQFQVHGKPVQGKLTSGENIADLGGLRLALRALKAQPNFDPTHKIDGFDPVQRFFLAWAQCWRQNITTERSLQLLTLDPHGPNELRCNGPLSNMSDFHEAFEIPLDSPMFKPAEVRVDIW